MLRRFILLFMCCLCTWFFVLIGTKAYAQVLPGSADPSRRTIQPKDILPPRPVQKDITPIFEGPPVAFEAPPGSEKLTITLKSVEITGVSVFTPQELRALYAPALGREVAVSRLWDLAARITKKYQDAGYILSRAYVPAQEIMGGHVRIGVVEGYISRVKVEGPLAQNRVVRQLADRMMDEVPARISVIESTMLRLDDIPGVKFSGILKPDIQNEHEGGVLLVLSPSQEEDRGSIDFDTYGSRYTGPQEIGFAYEKSFAPLHVTSMAAMMTMPDTQESQSFTLTHEVRLTPEISLKSDIEQSNTAPGYDLKDFDIRGNSLAWMGKVHWQIIRSRMYNFGLEGGVYIHNSNTDISNTPFARDRVRALRATGYYQDVDILGGTNLVNFTLTQGISGFGANTASDDLISRAEAKPDFTTLQANWKRQAFVISKILVSSFLSAQKASKPLYSSEEFGFGGNHLGRAYDESEILGDDGIAGSVEVAWTGAPKWRGMEIIPSTFYEVGRVWNQDDGQPVRLSGADLGFALILRYRNIMTHLSIAQPLTKPVDTPIIGENDKAPRVMFRLQIPL